MADLAWIGWVLAFLGLVAGYIYYRLNRKVKRIEWTILSDQSLLALPANEMPDRVTVNVGDDTLERPRAVLIRLKNTGNVGLSTKTMYRPFELVVSADNQLRTLSVVRMRAGEDDSERLPASVPPEGSVIPLPETLLNPGDEVSCLLLVDGSHGSVSVRGEAEDFTITGRRWASQETMKQKLRFLTLSALLAALLAVLTLALGFVLLNFEG
ncbi:hypothetical protein [Geodermatophilus sp. URMC 63]